jgi:hypothetical protein
MPHFFLQFLSENEWSLVRETESSQTFKVRTPDQKELGIDVPYTTPKILNVSISYIGAGEEPGRHGHCHAGSRRNCSQDRQRLCGDRLHAGVRRFYVRRKLHDRRTETADSQTINDARVAWTMGHAKLSICPPLRTLFAGTLRNDEADRALFR